MVNYGEFEICMPEVVNDAFVKFSYDQDFKLSAEELIWILIAYGLIDMGYMRKEDIDVAIKQITGR